MISKYRPWFRGRVSVNANFVAILFYFYFLVCFLNLDYKNSILRFLFAFFSKICFFKISITFLSVHNNRQFQCKSRLVLKTWTWKNFDIYRESFLSFFIHIYFFLFSFNFKNIPVALNSKATLRGKGPKKTELEIEVKKIVSFFPLLFHYRLLFFCRAQTLNSHQSFFFLLCLLNEIH